MMKLAEVLQNISCIYQKKKDAETVVSGIVFDSRQVQPGDLFVCITGMNTDGHRFVPQAVAKGAAAVLAEHEVELPENADVAVAIVKDTRQAMAQAAAAFYRYPSRRLRLIGVTGTNGKTTTTWLIRSILEYWGKKTGVMGTIRTMIDDVEADASRTTPEAPDIEKFLALCCQHRAEYAVMEVSSHALSLGRVQCMQYRQAIFTNLTQDHLDYHHTMEAYCQAKCELFRMVQPAPGNVCIVNRDDPFAESFIQAAKAPVITCSLHSGADLFVKDLQMNAAGTSFLFVWKEKSYPVHMKLVGDFNVHNALSAIASALCEGVPPETIREALCHVEGVPGRFQPVAEGQDYAVIVDYAHTPDGLENILQTGKKLVQNRLITVFGCGGDRDSTKRPIMGEIAARYSDRVIVTSDNPRSEEPEAIIRQIVAGIKKENYEIVPDRRQAIEKAIGMAQPGDLVMIAGKGHETYQLVKDQVLHFDDVEVARAYIRERAGKYYK